MKKIAIIGSVGIPAKYGGFETLAEYLTRELNEQFDLTVYCSSKSYPEKLKTHNNSKLKYVGFKANGIQSIPYDIISIFRAAKHNDTVLILGVAGCSFIPLLNIFRKRKLIVHIDGCEWKRDKWNKLAKWYLRFAEKKAMKYAAEIIADNAVIQDYVKNTYNRSSNLIEYGADQTTNLALTDSTREAYNIVGQYAFSVCRIEPENNIHLILEAFSKSETKLLFVGNWSYSDYGKELLAKYASHVNINLVDPIYDTNILDQMRSNCSLYIHGHSAGGTNPSLVEAMSLGLNIIAFDVNYNRKTTEDSAIYFRNEEELLTIINNTSRALNGPKLKVIADKRYKWKIIAEKYAKLF